MKKLSFLLLLVLIGCVNKPKSTSNNDTSNNYTFKDYVSDKGIFTDSRDERHYKWVKIGEQTWMEENLAYLPAVSPNSEGSESSAFYYVYHYEGSSISEAKSKGNYTTYGVLYNWEAAKTACPSGWHLPTDAEWTILEDYLGALPGKKMKSITEWSENGNGDNSSGFNALPGGIRDDHGVFLGLGYGAYFWSASENGTSFAWARFLTYVEGGVNRYDYDGRGLGVSVRCLKD